MIADPLAAYRLTPEEVEHFRQAAVYPTIVEGWGTPKRQGKRVGKTVMGAMSDGPRGIKHYKDLRHAEGVTPELYELLRCMPDEDQDLIVGCVQSGYSIEDAEKIGFVNGG